MANRAAASETTFVKHDGSTMTIRLSEDNYGAMCKAAETLKARFFVCAIEFDHRRNGCWWEVIDAHKVQKGNPTPHEWTVPEPLKRFPPGAHDAAVMYAVAMLGVR